MLQQRAILRTGRVRSSEAVGKVVNVFQGEVVTVVCWLLGFVFGSHRFFRASDSHGGI